MEQDKTAYISYLLRMWPTKSEDEWVWRASLENPDIGKRQGFANLQDLFAYLEEQTIRVSEQEDNAPGL